MREKARQAVPDMLGDRHAACPTVRGRRLKPVHQPQLNEEWHELKFVDVKESLVAKLERGNDEEREE